MFNQLSDDERERAIETCVGMVLEDIADNEIDLEMFSGEDAGIRKTLEKAIKQVGKIEKPEDRIDVLLANQKVMDIAYNIATEMYKGFIYIEDIDRVMFPPDYQEEAECPHCKAEAEQEAGLDEIKPTGKHKHNVN